MRSLVFSNCQFLKLRHREIEKVSQAAQLEGGGIGSNSLGRRLQGSWPWHQLPQSWGQKETHSFLPCGEKASSGRWFLVLKLCTERTDGSPRLPSCLAAATTKKGLEGEFCKPGPVQVAPFSGITPVLIQMVGYHTFSLCVSSVPRSCDPDLCLGADWGRK